jgi:hypothetical protein
MALKGPLERISSNQVHVGCSEHACVEHGHDAGRDDVAWAADELGEDVELRPIWWIRFGRNLRTNSGS